MKILVTGGAGFIGSKLVNTLRQSGNDVSVFDLNATPKGDITSSEQCLEATKGVSTVYHLAAVKSVPESIQMPLWYNTVNIDGTVKILRAAVENKVNKFIFASSAAVYGDRDSANILEAFKAQPISPYGVTKLAGEQYCRTFAYQYGIRCVALRFFNVYGPGQDVNDGYAGVISKFISAMVKGERPTIFGDGKQVRDFIHIDDVVSALCAAHHPRLMRDFEEFNIGSGRGRTLLEIIDIANKQLMAHIEPVYLPAQEGDIRCSVAEIHKAEMYLGWKPQVRFPNGLLETIKHFQGYQIYKDNRNV